VTTKKDADVSTPSGAHDRMRPRLALIDTLLSGTEGMHAAGEVHLPKHENESATAYKARLARSVLLPALEDTLDTLTGKPFAEDVVLGEDIPPQVMALLGDVDLQGNALQPFLRSWFREGWAKGLSVVLTDFPVSEQPLGDDGKPRARTLADDRAENVRPYTVQIRPENIIAAYAETVNGRERLTHVRILEVTTERRGYEEVCVERIQVLEPGRWELWEYADEKKEKWHLVDEGPTGLANIPLTVFYAGKRIGLLEAMPPLTGLAHLNIAHWQSSSDQRNILTVARFPILAGSGVDSDAKITVGPNNFLTTESADGKWYYVEHTGAAIESGAKDLETLENQMAAYGSEFLRSRPGNETATGRAIDSAEATSYLAATVQGFKDCVEEVLQHMAEWLKLDTGGSVELRGDYTLEEANQPELDALRKARDARDISRTAYLAELKRRKVLKDDFDEAADKELLDREAADGLAMADGTTMFGPAGKPTGATE
jgi:hypothetical protein